MYLAVSAQRTRGGKLENHERCPGSTPVSWIPASECGTGACGADWNTSHPLMVPRCAGRSTLRHFNRSSVMHCLRQLSSMSGKPRYRLLMGGVSNALHIFRALQDDDSLEPWERERSRKAHPSCPPLSTVRLRAFAPHALVRHASAPFEPTCQPPSLSHRAPLHCVCDGRTTIHSRWSLIPQLCCTRARRLVGWSARWAAAAQHGQSHRATRSIESAPSKKRSIAARGC